MKRLPQLDILRAIAILLVIARHSDFGGIFYLIGWIGVNLFFVLSGFLISQLLFIEYKKEKKIRPLNFLIKRGFKIYPSFYFFLATFFLVKFFFFDIQFSVYDIIPELTFTQNIFGGINYHTWSLGVEEQFYFFLAVFFLICFNFFKLRPNFILRFSVIMILAFPILRICLSQIEKLPAFIRYFCVYDAFFYGIIAAWIVQFLEIKFTPKKKRLLDLSLLLVPFLLIPLCTLYDDIKSLYQFGYTSTYIAFFIILIQFYYRFPLTCIQKYILTNWPMKLITFIGFCSYNIYLWHILTKDLLEKYVIVEKELFVFIYVILCIVVGVFFTYLIEQPFLRFRNKVMR